MSTAKGQMTPYPEVDRLLDELLERIRLLLGSHFTGMYLYGSLAMGDFVASRSDIDFVVVTEGLLPEETVAELQSMHRELAGRSGRWWRKLEGVYVPKTIIRRHDPRHPAVPTINEGSFYRAPLGSDWVIQRYVLREAGVTLAGPSPARLIEPIGPEDVRAAVLAVLAQWWEPMLADPSRLRAPGYQPFAVLSMCRALYTVRTGRLASKPEAAKWARDMVPAEWAPLINRALQWRDGDEVESIEQTTAFMRHAIEKCRLWDDRQPAESGSLGE